MLRWISIFGGLLIMMGSHDRSEALFYYFRLEDQVPENHLLRLIDKYISFDFVREQLKDSYSDTGRPSIDPELLFRILLVGYLYGITSERRLVEELRMHLAWRWFTGLGFDQEIPHHSTFSKNRHGRFHESKLFQQLFEEIVIRCMKAGLVKGEHLSVDGSFIQANASNASRIPREQLQEAAVVNHTVREYLSELEKENGDGEEAPHQQDRVSTTDPDATYASKRYTVASLGYFDNYLVDNHSCVIVDVEATAARLSQESVAARDMITRFTERRGGPPQTVAADTTYGNGEMLDWLEQHSITGHIPVKECPLGKSGLYGVEQFTYRPENNSYVCPEGKQLTYTGINVLNRTHMYVSTPKRCRDCSQKALCTRGKTRVLQIHIYEGARQRARERAMTPEFEIARRARKKVEALFAELKNQIGLRRLRLRRMKFVREQFFLAAAVQNMKRLVKFLARTTPPLVEVSA